MVTIGTNLARIKLYRQVFPTARILQIVSQLYAAIVDFLRGFVLYLQKKTYSKYDIRLASL